MKLTENPAKNRLLARLIAFILFLLLLLLLSSCKTTSNTTDIVPVHSATHDTILLSKVKYDSVYIDRWQRIERKADTVFCDRVKTEFRYRLLRDTVYKTRTDTVPQQGGIRFGLYRPMAAYRAQGRHGVLRQSENRVSLPPPQRYSL